MATTSFLYHSLGLAGYKHLRTEFTNGWIYHHVERAAEKRTCGNCGARWANLTFAGTFERTFFALPVGSRPQFVVLHGHRQSCCECGKTRREPIPFTEGKKRYIRAFARFAVQLCTLSTIKHVAGLLGVGWDLVKEIHKSWLRRKEKKRTLSAVRYIAIDEKAIRKGQVYMTIVMDLETGDILYANEGRDAAAVTGFLRKLKRGGSKLKAVAVDMSPAYVKAVKEVFKGKIDIVHDPFHVVGLVNKAIDDTRRDMMRDLEGEERKVVKGSRYLLLKGLESLDERGLVRLMELMDLNEPLYRLYLLKEDLRQFWSLPDAELGGAFLDVWVAEAHATGNAHFQRLARTLTRSRERLLTYFTHRISTGPLEGLNNKIGVLKRQTYGLRDMEYFKLRLYFLHEAAFAVLG